MKYVARIETFRNGGSPSWCPWKFTRLADGSVMMEIKSDFSAPPVVSVTRNEITRADAPVES